MTALNELGEIKKKGMILCLANDAALLQRMGILYVAGNSSLKELDSLHKTRNISVYSYGSK